MSGGGDEQGYNGWTNYETWCVSLWMSNDEGSYETFREMTLAADGDYELSNQFKEYHEEAAADALAQENGVFVDLLRGALSVVNWREIAKNWIADETAVS